MFSHGNTNSTKLYWNSKTNRRTYNANEGIHYKVYDTTTRQLSDNSVQKELPQNGYYFQLPWQSSNDIEKLKSYYTVKSQIKIDNLFGYMMVYQLEKRTI